MSHLQRRYTGDIGPLAAPPVRAGHTLPEQFSHRKMLARLGIGLAGVVTAGSSIV
jgi:hypothetical protein